MLTTEDFAIHILHLYAGWDCSSFLLGIDTTYAGYAQGGFHSNDNALYKASNAGHNKIVELLLNKGADVNAQGGFYSNALYAASLGGHDKIVDLLLNKGADVNAKGGRYGSALYFTRAPTLTRKAETMATHSRRHPSEATIRLSICCSTSALTSTPKADITTTHSRRHQQEATTRPSSWCLSNGADINAQGGA